MTNALAIKEETIAALDAAAKKGAIAQAEGSSFKKMFLVSQAMTDLLSLLTPEVMKPIMALQGKAIGFKTDKDKSGGYPESVVKECLAEATLNGAYPVWNQFNIISGRAYITKEGFGEKLKNVEGLRYIITPGIPKTQQGGAVVSMTTDWEIDGRRKTETLEYAIRVNAGMGADAIIGKATRKARARLYSMITGLELGDGDANDADVIDVQGGSKFEQKTPLYAEPGNAKEFVDQVESENAEELLKNTPISIKDVQEYCRAMGLEYKPATIISNKDNVVSAVLDWIDSKGGSE